MKHVQFILTLSCFLLFTCQTDTVVDTEAQDIEIQESPEANENSARKGPKADEFEIKLQWAAYAAAKVYLHNKDARDEVIATMDGNTVSLEKLIGSRSKTSPFYTEFIKELAYYYELWHKTGSEEQEDTPPDDIAVCCQIPPTTDAAVGRFIDYLLLDNCVEFYFPNLELFEFGDKIEHITSTAHPLTEASENYGYWRYPKAHVYPDGFYGIAHEITVDETFVEKEGLVLVARPIRDEKDPDCKYEKYDVQDFTTFLNVID